MGTASSQLKLCCTLLVLEHGRRDKRQQQHSYISYLQTTWHFSALFLWSEHLKQRNSNNKCKLLCLTPHLPHLFLFRRITCLHILGRQLQSKIKSSTRTETLFIISRKCRFLYGHLLASSWRQHPWLCINVIVFPSCTPSKETLRAPEAEVSNCLTLLEVSIFQPNCTAGGSLPKTDCRETPSNKNYTFFLLQCKPKLWHLLEQNSWQQKVTRTSYHWWRENTSCWHPA